MDNQHQNNKQIVYGEHLPNNGESKTPTNSKRDNTIKEKWEMYYVEYYDKLFKKTRRKSFASGLDAIDYARKKNGIVGSY